MDTKGILASKLNWIGAFLAILGLFSDPTFAQLIGSLVPQEVLSRVTAVAGLVIIVVRTFFTSMKIEIGGGGTGSGS